MTKKELEKRLYKAYGDIYKKCGVEEWDTSLGASSVVNACFDKIEEEFNIDIFNRKEV